MTNACGVHVRTLFKHQIGDLTARGRKTVVMFFSQHCGHCHETMPQLQWASMSLCDYDFWLADVDALSALADEYKIKALPTLVLLSPAGKELKRVEGFHDAEGIVNFAS